ncbi:MAG TPA: GntR family transcriptional regulator [Afifellaceae bacterium]|nr:GntR family transcriptional regulator [Afifellaceae bacterium]
MSACQGGGHIETLTEAIARELEEEILSGRLRPRGRLVETELAMRFSVSRAPVREALRMLEREGLVSRGLRGLQVAEISLDEVREIFEVLADLEELYTRRAVPHLTRGEIGRMQVLVERMQAAAAAGDLRLYFDLNDRFHGVLRDACPNRTLIRLLASLGKKTQRFRRMAMSLPGRLSRSLPEHLDILADVRAGNAEAAGLRARASAERAHLELLDFLQHAPDFL